MRDARALRLASAAVIASAVLAALAPAVHADPSTQPPAPQTEPSVPPATHAQPTPPSPPAAPTTRAQSAQPSPPAPPAPIDPAPHFELLDRGDAVEVIAHNVKAARTAVLPVRSRLEVPITGAPQAKRVVPSDATVKLIEIDAQETTRVLSVKLGFERGDVKALSRFAQAIQVGDDLHLLVPRKLPDDGVPPRLPDPTVPPAPPSASAVLGPSPDPRAIVPPAAPVAAAAAKPAKQETPAAGAARPRSAADALAAGPSTPPVAAATSPAAPAGPSSGPGYHAGNHQSNHQSNQPSNPSLDHTFAPDHDDPWSRISMYGALGLAAAGAGVWILRRRRGVRPGTSASIEVIAQRSLGGRARIVWLSAGAREMIVSVTGQQVRMLSQWRKTDAPAALPAAHTHNDSELLRDSLLEAPIPRFDQIPRPVTGSRRTLPAGSIPVPAIDKPMSPAVSGLLRLRGRTGQMAAVPEDIAADVEADELWAKEILAATTARPGGRS